MFMPDDANENKNDREDFKRYESKGARPKTNR